MSQYPTSFDKDDLLKCARGELFGPGNAQLPAPPMLMMDRITEISGDADPDDDGLTNREEYAFGQDPTQSSQAILSVQGARQFRYRRRDPARTGLTRRVEGTPLISAPGRGRGRDPNF